MIKNNQAIESFILSSKIAAQKKWKKRNFKLVNNSSKKGKIIYYLFCLIKLFKKRSVTETVYKYSNTFSYCSYYY